MDCYFEFGCDICPEFMFVNASTTRDEALAVVNKNQV